MKGRRVIKLALLGTAFTAAYVVIFIHVFRPLGYPHAPPTYLLANVDSLLFFSSFHAARDFGSVADLQAFAFGQGFGAFQHPALFNLFWWLLDWTTSAELTYLITEFLVFASVFAFAHFVSGSLIVSGLAAFSPRRSSSYRRCSSIISGLRRRRRSCRSRSPISPSRRSVLACAAGSG